MFDKDLTRYFEFQYIVGDNKKIKENLGWKPKFFGEQLIEKLIEDEMQVN